MRPRSATSSLPPRIRSAFSAALVALVAGTAVATALAVPANAQLLPAANHVDPSKPQTDFNGDGKADIFWYGPGTVADSLWTSTGGTDFTSSGYAVNAVYQPISGDFDGDGKSDIFWYRPGTGSDSIWTSTGGGFNTRDFAVNAVYQPFTGDFNGDGMYDIFWYAPGAGADSLWTSTGSGFTSRALNVGGVYEPFVGDFDGDGDSDIFWYRPGTQSDAIWFFSPSGAFVSEARTINAVYEPFVGDFNGDDKSDIFWYAPGAVADQLWLTSPSGFIFSTLAVNGRYIALPGDYSGDGRSDILWYAPGAGADSIWTFRADGSFSSTAKAVNGNYQPIGGTDNPTPPAPAIAPSKPGDRSHQVTLLQRKLISLNYWLPAANGFYDSVTAQAVMAFQKYEGLGRDGVAGPGTIARLLKAAPARAREGGNHVEISIAKQTLIVVRNGRTVVMNTSTGRSGYNTPPGRFIMNRQINGMRHAPLGDLWRPKYFNGGIAMHGSPSIPAYPASHGCARLHNTMINYLWDANLVPLGTPVWVY